MLNFRQPPAYAAGVGLTTVLELMKINRALKERTPDQLAQRAYAYAKPRLNRPGIIECAIAVSDNVNNQIDELRVVVESSGIKFDCIAGCTYCCTLRVDATAPDIFRIARQVSTRQDLPELLGLLENYSKKVSGLKPQDHYEPCVFLKDNLCSIYDYRPSSCRKYLSTSVETCKKLDAPVPESAEMRHKSDAILQGFSVAMQHAGTSGTLHELGQSVYIALTQSDAELRWENGETVFPELP